MGRIIIVVFVSVVIVIFGVEKQICQGKYCCQIN